jgi:hypothetical protein
VVAVINVGPLGPVGPDGRPPDWIDGASPLELARLAHLGDLGDDLAWQAAAAEIRARWEAGPERAQLSGLINAVSGLQSNLQAAGIMDGPPGERLARPHDIRPLYVPPKTIRRRFYSGLDGKPMRARPLSWPDGPALPAAAVAAVLAVVLFAPLWAALPAAGAAVLALAARAVTWLWRQPGRTADLYPAPKLIPPARTRAGLYAAARARYLATGSPADLAEMLGHVGATPDDGGPAWAPPQ